MAKTYFMLTSVTYAYKAQRLLEKHWIKCAVVRTPKVHRDTGCSYSLQVDSAKEAEAEAIIRESGIKILRIARL